MTDFTRTRPHLYVSGAVILAANHNDNEDEILDGHNDSMHATTGHTHSGATGDGTKLTSTGINLTGNFAWTGVHSWQSGELKLGDSDASHHYIFVGSNIAADRNVILPVLAGNDTFVMAALSQTLSNKVSDTDFSIYGGFDLKLYSDAGTTLQASIDGATGTALLGRASANSINASRLDVLSSSVYLGTFETTDAGGTGVVLQAFHNSASPANGDSPFNLHSYGKSSTGVTRRYGTFYSYIIDQTNGSEDAEWVLSALVNGSDLDLYRFGGEALKIQSAVDLRIYSDAGATLKAQIDGTSGFALFGRASANSLAVTVIDALSGSPELLNLECTSAGATGVISQTYHNSASPADNDTVFQFLGYGNHDGGSPVAYGKQELIATDVSSGTEDSKWVFSVVKAGATVTGLTIGTTDGRVEISSAFNLSVEPTKSVFYDGGGDTYDIESSANVLDRYVGGSISCRFFSTGIAVQSGDFVYFDGGSDTYDTESSANVLDRYAGGVLALRCTASSAVVHTNSTFNTSGELLLGDVDPPTANYANRNGIVKGWVNYTDGAPGSVADSYNVTSVTGDDGDGDFLVNWNTDFSSTARSVVGSCVSSSPTDRILTILGTSAGTTEVNIYDVSGAGGADDSFCLIAIGNQ